MGANLEYQRLVKTRNKIVDKILENIRSWDKEIETGIELVDENKVEINKIKEINAIIDKLNVDNLHDDEYKEKLIELYIEQKNLFKNLELLNRRLFREKEQLNKRDKVVKSYINKKNKPLFIDKDIE